jgi:hypothetical protein
MNKLLIIVFDYNQENSINTNALCIHNLITSIKKKYLIEIITTSNNDDLKISSSFNQKIHFIPISKSESSKKKLFSWQKSALEYVNKNLDLTTYSNLITISFPFNNHLIGYSLKLRYNNLNWTIYDLDPYTFNPILSNFLLLFPLRLIKEMIIFNTANKILLTHELYKQYKLKGPFWFFRKKMNDIGIPIMKIYNNLLIKKTINKNNNIFALYIGSFYSKIRSPEYMFNLFKEILKKDNRIMLLIVGSSHKKSSEYKDKSLHRRIFFIDRVSKKRVLKYIQKASFLINIGNKSANQLPSKILEYIGTGKPIINFYSIKNDTSNNYLLNYPNSLLVDQNISLLSNLENVYSFIYANVNKNLSYRYLMKHYSVFTISSTSKRVVDSLNID